MARGWSHLRGLRPPRAAAGRVSQLSQLTELFGDATRRDEFHWLGNPTSSAVRRQMQRETSFLQAALRPTEPLQKELYSEMARRVARTHESLPETHGDWSYYSRTAQRKELPTFYRQRSAGSGAAQTLLDLSALANRHGFAGVGQLTPSPSGRLLACTLDLSGTEEWELWVTEAASGRTLSKISGAFSFEWAAEEMLMYTAVDERGRPNRALLHRPGHTSSSDIALFEEEDPAFVLDVSATKDRRWLSLNSNSRSTSEVRLLRAGEAGAAAPPAHQLRLLAPRVDGVRAFVESLGRSGWLLLVTSGGLFGREGGGEGGLRAAAERVLECAPGQSAPGQSAPGQSAPGQSTNDARPTTLGLALAHESQIPLAQREMIPLRLPDASAQIEDVDVFSNWIVLYERRAAVPAIRVLQLESSPSTCDATSDATCPPPPSISGEHLVSLPTRGAPSRVTPARNAHFEAHTAFFELSAPNQPPVELKYQMEQRSLTERRPSQGAPPEVPLHCEMRWVRASDGSGHIPVTITHRKGLRLDGSAPLLVNVYGAYGAPLHAEFRAEHLPLLERGWTLALAHVRGGGELGPQWHHAARLHHKQRSATDLVAVLRALHQWGYSRPGRTAAHADSAGGLALGGMLNMRPQLVHAAILRSAFLDPSTAMLRPELPLTLEEYEEWGNPATDPAAHEAIRQYAPYDNLREVEYPAMLLIASEHDPRVPCTHALRYLARLRHRALRAAEPAPPQLLQMLASGGHYGDGGRFRRLEQAALEMAFLMRAIETTSSARVVV